MKNVKEVLLLVLAMFILCPVMQAQELSKDEKKRLKQEIKIYKKDPAKSKKLKEDHKHEIKELNDELEKVRANLADSWKENDALKDSLAELRAKYASLMKDYKKNSFDPNPMGTVYKGQIGLYSSLDLASFNETFKSVYAEEVDGAKRYIIGHFDDVQDAKNFANDLKKVGIKGAFVSQYIDGERDMSFDAYR